MSKKHLHANVQPPRKNWKKMPGHHEKQRQHNLSGATQPLARKKKKRRELAPPPPPQCNMYDFLFFAPFHTCMTTQFVIFYNQNINQFSPKNVIFSRVATLHVIKRNLWDGRAQKRGNFQPNWNLIYIFCSLHPTLQDFEVDSVSRNLTLSKTITRWFINHSNL